MKETEQLLRSYVEQGSEPAFRELVERYIDLVYSVALRKVDGDAHLAQDVAQNVFTDLAAKARILPREVMLGGWLHRHTCFAAATLMRTERRRQLRTQQAMEMNALNNDADATWKQLTPVLDDAINELEAVDREAILLRFFERQDLRAVGVRLGVSDDAAQKRVGRAIEKLRGLLANRGVALSVIALAAGLAEGAIQAAPTGLGATVSVPALNGKAKTGFRKLSGLRKLAIGLVTALVIGLVSLPTVRSMLIGKGDHQAGVSQSATAAKVAPDSTTPTNTAVVDLATETRSSSSNLPSGTNLDAKEDGILQLTILAADTGKPVSAGQVESRRYDGEKFIGKTYTSDSNGVCKVPFLPKTTELALTTQIDGFADTRLEWHPGNGEHIPEKYTVKLTRPVWIGGRVVGPDNEPVAGAKVGFNHMDDTEADKKNETHAFVWIQVTTAQDGRWEINRIAPEMLRRMHGGASHSNYTSSGHQMINEKPETEIQLKEGTHVFRLGRIMSVRGVVLDPDGQPVAQANVAAGNIDTVGRVTAKSLEDGTFVLNGCKPGKNLLTAEAKGFAATTIEAEFTPESAPFELRLQRGKVLRLRVLNKEGHPIPKATAWLNCFNIHPEAKPKAQASFNRKTDAEGRIVWENAPDEELEFAVYAPNYMHHPALKVHPDGEEHVIKLNHPLVIAGTVQDSANGQVVTRFRIGAGYVETNLVDNSTQPSWSTLDRFWVNYNGGQFRHTMTEQVVQSFDDFVFRFEADGYEPYVTRTIRGDEGEVQLEIKLNRADEKYVTVLLPDGTPATRADVGLSRPGGRLTIQLDGISRQDAQVITTDAQGHFVLPADRDVTRVIIVHAQGFLETTMAALTAKPTAQLQAWGKITGTFLSGGQPAPGKSVSFTYDENGSWTVSCDIQAFSATADAQGHFTLPQVPPGLHQLGQWIKNGMGNSTTRSLSIIQEVTVRPGETTEVVIGTGYQVNVHLKWPSGSSGGKGWQKIVGLHSPVPQPPAGLMRDQAALAKWQEEHPEIVAAWKNMKRYMMNENEDGSWTAEGVEPGSYEFQAITVSGADSGTGNNPLQATLQVEVPREPASGVLEAGEVVLVRGE